MCKTETSAITSLTVKYLIGKQFIQEVKRQGLTLRNRIKNLNRKTLEYSGSAEMHDKIIGTFIEMEHYI